MSENERQQHNRHAEQPIPRVHAFPPELMSDGRVLFLGASAIFDFLPASRISDAVIRPVCSRKTVSAMVSVSFTYNAQCFYN
jgi:hypothetical protein